MQLVKQPKPVPSSKTNALLIFIKNPEKGNVKTRLAATLGEGKALNIYRRLLDHTRRTAQPLQADKQVWYSRYVDTNDAWDNELFSKKSQHGNNLGARMQHAFREAFEEGYQHVAIIGSDCGQLSTDHLRQAYEALEGNDVVLGPSEDGGYYLLGMRRFLPVLFKQKAWSTASVLGQTIADCEEHGFRYHVLEQLNDVDTEEDWDQIKDHF